jgi:hypothetical protein
MFASGSFFEHLLRGLIGAGSFALAIWKGSAEGGIAIVLSLALAAVGLVALRGCPICWTTGLIEMVSAKMGPRSRPKG